MRNRTLFAAALAFVLTIGGLALSAQETTMDIVAKMDVNLKDNLTSAATGETSFGYKKQGGGFYSLSSAMESATIENGKAVVQLGNFSSGEEIQFGYASSDEGNDFTAAMVKVASDPGYSYTYNSDSFYKLDFSNSAFDGNIEIYPIGAPLPAQTVTLLVALAAAAALLLYNNRRKQRISGQA